MLGTTRSFRYEDVSSRLLQLAWICPTEQSCINITLVSQMQAAWAPAGRTSRGRPCCQTRDWMLNTTCIVGPPAALIDIFWPLGGRRAPLMDTNLTCFHWSCLFAPVCFCLSAGSHRLLNGFLQNSDWGWEQILLLLVWIRIKEQIQECISSQTVLFS